MLFEWKNKAVLITGAANGIGAEVVRKLLDEDVKFVAVLDLAEEAGIDFENELKVKYGENKVKFFKCDVTEDDQLLGPFETIANDFGSIDVVINNAGIMNDSLNMYKKQIEVNVTALVTGTLKALELMRKDQGGMGGTVINISSVAGLTLRPQMPIYWATKSAVIQFSNCIGHAEYYEKTGVRVLTICFGATSTALLSAECLGSYDKQIEASLVDDLKAFPIQSKESAAHGLIEAYKHGESGSTWLVSSNKPQVDITATISQAYSMLEKLVLQ